MSYCKPVVACVTIGTAVWLQGCGITSTTTTTTTSTTTSTHTSSTRTTSTSTTTTLYFAENIWQFRKDMDYAVQTTDDMSGDYTRKSLYGGCYQNQFHLPIEDVAAAWDVGQRPLEEQCKQNGKSFCQFSGATGVTLFNKRKTSSKPGCLMRKSRLPIDLSEIGRMELDITTSGSTGKAPWFAVWLVPMIYPEKAAAENSAEIDLIENFEYPASMHGQDVNNVNTQFSTCGLNQAAYRYTLPYCQNYRWGAVADRLNYHITLKATPEEGRTLEVHRCAHGSPTCSAPDSKIASVKVGKPAPHGHQDWFPVWNKERAGAAYGKYWLVADIWYTSETDFRMNVENVKFYFNNESEWTMPLDGLPPSFVQPRSHMRSEIIV